MGEVCVSPSLWDTEAREAERQDVEQLCLGRWRKQLEIHNLIDLSNIILPKKRGLKFTLPSSNLLFSPPPQAFF